MKINFYGKTSDSFGMTIVLADGTSVDYDGYPPSFLGGGDGVGLKIDINTGTIIGWDAEKAKAALKEIIDNELE